MHIDRLVLFAGPSCSGKSTVIKRLQEGEIPSLSEQLELGDPASWEFLHVRSWHRLPESHINRTIMHYDFMTILKPTRQHQWFEEDERLDFLHTSNEITFVTFWVTPKILIPRLRPRKLDVFRYLIKSRNFHKALEKIRHLREVQRIYTNPPELFHLYNKWFKFCDTFVAKERWIINPMEDVSKLFRLSQWPNLQNLEKVSSRLTGWSN